jgi:hypothetical protein
MLERTLVPAKNAASTMSGSKPVIGSVSRPRPRSASRKWAACSVPIFQAVSLGEHYPTLKYYKDAAAFDALRILKRPPPRGDADVPQPVKRYGVISLACFQDAIEKF